MRPVFLLRLLIHNNVFLMASQPSAYVRPGFVTCSVIFFILPPSLILIGQHRIVASMKTAHLYSAARFAMQKTRPTTPQASQEPW